MPQFVLKTNVSKCKIPKDFWSKTTEIVANMLEKPASATMVGQTNQPINLAID